MNTKRILFGLATVFILMAAACTPNTAEDDQLYDQAVNKEKLTKKI